jgi:hypothetical protein
MGHLIRLRNIVDNAAKRGYISLSPEQKNILKPYADNFGRMVEKLAMDSESETGIIGIVQGAVADNLSNWMETMKGALFSYDNPGPIRERVKETIPSVRPSAAPSVIPSVRPSAGVVSPEKARQIEEAKRKAEEIKRKVAEAQRAQVAEQKAKMIRMQAEAAARRAAEEKKRLEEKAKARLPEPPTDVLSTLARGFARRTGVKPEPPPGYEWAIP